MIDKSKGKCKCKALKNKGKGPSPSYYGFFDIEDIENIADAGKLLSRITVGFLKGKLEGQKAKTAAYLLQTLVGIYRESSLEEKIKKIEEALTERGLLK